MCRDSKDMKVLQKIVGSHKHGIPLLAFNSKGNVIASVGLDSDCSLAIHEWSKGVQILRTPTDKNKVLCICFLFNDPVAAFNSVTGQSSLGIDKSSSLPEKDIIVTAGEKHLKFWWYQGQNVQSQRAMWGSNRDQKTSTVMSVASANQGILISGSNKGDILIWQNFKVSIFLSPFT